jgi:hypothetical protein
MKLNLNALRDLGHYRRTGHFPYQPPTPDQIERRRQFEVNLQRLDRESARLADTPEEKRHQVAETFIAEFHGRTTTGKLGYSLKVGSNREDVRSQALHNVVIQGNNSEDFDGDQLGSYELPGDLVN